jgi:dTDP-4-amino-4,6-dideoxygalactose transaminase
MFHIILNSFVERTDLIEHLKKNGILAVFHYVPLHTSPMGKAMGYREGMFPVCEQLSDRLLRLPMYYEISQSEVLEVIGEIFKFFGVDYRSVALDCYERSVPANNTATAVSR